MHIILVTGDRKWDDTPAVWHTLDQRRKQHGRLCIVEGGAKGADLAARTWRIVRRVAGITFEADWKKFGRIAGPIRNREMGTYVLYQLELSQDTTAEVLAFHDDLRRSKGTRDMIKFAKAHGLEVNLCHHRS